MGMDVDVDVDVDVEKKSAGFAGAFVDRMVETKGVSELVCVCVHHERIDSCLFFFFTSS